MSFVQEHTNDDVTGCTVCRLCRTYGQKIARLHCSTKLHLCNDAFSALPSSLAVVCCDCMDDIQEGISVVEDRSP